MALAILATPSFARMAKKLRSPEKQDKAVLDAAAQAVARGAGFARGRAA